MTSRMSRHRPWRWLGLPSRSLWRRLGVRSLCLALAFCAAALPAFAQTAPPELTAPVNDFAGVIDRSGEEQLETLIRKLQAASGDVMIVATVKTFQPWADLQSYRLDYILAGDVRGLDAQA